MHVVKAGSLEKLNFLLLLLFSFYPCMSFEFFFACICFLLLYFWAINKKTLAIIVFVCGITYTTGSSTCDCPALHHPQFCIDPTPHSCPALKLHQKEGPGLGLGRLGSNLCYTSNSWKWCNYISCVSHRVRIVHALLQNFHLLLRSYYAFIMLILYSVMS